MFAYIEKKKTKFVDTFLSNFLFYFFCCILKLKITEWVNCLRDVQWNNNFYCLWKVKVSIQLEIGKFVAKKSSHQP